jgi:multidrug/hemolysin transport system permease protein
LGFLPGTYGTSLLRNHALNGVIGEIENLGAPIQAITGLRDSTDCNLYFFDVAVSEPVKYIILIGSVLLFMGIYILLNVMRAKKLTKSKTK